jgi:DNA repair protein RecO (recombination protein O)
VLGRSYKSEGIVLARRDYGEADRILILFSKDFGKLSLLAKGIRKLKSRKRGHLEVFSYIKFSAISGKGLDIITEAEIINNFSLVRKNLKKVSVAYYFMEVVGRVTREGEKNEDLFEIILDYLARLEKTDKLSSLRKGFVIDILVVLGFWPKAKEMFDPDQVLEEVVERKINSVRVGKRVLM